MFLTKNVTIPIFCPKSQNFSKTRDPHKIFVTHGHRRFGLLRISMFELFAAVNYYEIAVKVKSPQKSRYDRTSQEWPDSALSLRLKIPVEGILWRVSRHFVLCHLNRCNFNRCNLNRCNYNHSPFQQLFFPTACHFNRLQFQLPHIQPPK